MKTPVIRKTYDARHVALCIDCLAQEILETVGPSAASLALVGIQRRGAVLAQRLQEKIQAATHQDVPLGALDITLYRDDLGHMSSEPVVTETQLNFDINDKVILLIDDVLFTGRTVQAALHELYDFGRPLKIYLAVLVDRGHRELPIAPDFVGEEISTDADESVDVHFVELDGIDEIVVVRGST